MAARAGTWPRRLRGRGRGLAVLGAALAVVALVVVVRDSRDRARLLPPGASLPSDEHAARQVERGSFEPRPGNARANRRTPSRAELERFRAASVYNRPPSTATGRRARGYLARVTGDFTGTTDEIIQWAAWKWGLDEDLLRAQAVQESHWRQSAVGDGGHSFGLMQLKATKQYGTFPLSKLSTAFNIDYAGMLLRHCYDGYATWLGPDYRAGDIAGCLGFYFSGDWQSPHGRSYAAQVFEREDRRDWEHEQF